MNFTEAMERTERGFATWAAQPHNRRWVRRIEGTPIANDLLVRIAEEFCGIADREREHNPAPDPWADSDLGPDLPSLPDTRAPLFSRENPNRNLAIVTAVLVVLLVIGGLWAFAAVQ